MEETAEGKQKGPEKIKKLLIIALLVTGLGIIGFYIYSTFLVHRKPSNYCGSWGPLIGGSPTCTCDGTIVQKGGPAGPADDSGGYYECIGTIISNPE